MFYTNHCTTLIVFTAEHIDKNNVQLQTALFEIVSCFVIGQEVCPLFRRTDVCNKATISCQLGRAADSSLVYFLLPMKVLVVCRLRSWLLRKAPS
jgi:hypothetical protein